MTEFTLGITGHRILAEVDKIMAGVEEAVQYICWAYPGSSFRILSSLAEGTDRILANRLLQIPNAVLWVSLPMPREEYLKDFESSSSKEEFNRLLEIAEQVIQVSAKEKREESYLAAGQYILENSDCLLTIWDGKRAQGMAGTGEIVSLARQRSLPLAWIHAGNRQPGTNHPTSLGPEQGKVTFEHFPQPGRTP
jgi:hypothetical protein